VNRGADTVRIAALLAKASTSRSSRRSRSALTFGVNGAGAIEQRLDRPRRADIAVDLESGEDEALGELRQRPHRLDVSQGQLVLDPGQLGEDVADAALDVLIGELRVGAIVREPVGRELLRFGEEERREGSGAASGAAEEGGSLGLQLLELREEGGRFGVAAPGAARGRREASGAAPGAGRASQRRQARSSAHAG
jgi:hypothetical protein